MILKEIIGNHFPDKLQRSTVSPWGENKRGEFLHLAPPPSPRQSLLHRDRLGDILRFHFCFFLYIYTLRFYKTNYFIR